MWRYYGGTNLLIITYGKFDLDFNSVYYIDLTRILIDNAIIDYKMFIEEITKKRIRYILYQCYDTIKN